MTILPVGTSPALVIFIVLVLAYVFFGGGISLGYMGIHKTVLMALDFALCGIVAIREMGPDLFSIPAEPYFNIFSGGVRKNLSQVISLTFGIITGQNYTSALITGRSYRESRKAILLSSLIGPAIGLFCIFERYNMTLSPPGEPINSIHLLLQGYFSLHITVIAKSILSMSWSHRLWQP